MTITEKIFLSLDFDEEVRVLVEKAKCFVDNFILEKTDTIKGFISTIKNADKLFNFDEILTNIENNLELKDKIIIRKSKETLNNVLADILEQVARRTTGAEGSVKITALTAIEHNMKTFFIGSNIAFFGLALVVYAIYALRRPKPFAEWVRALPVSAVSLYPFVWYCVLQNHVRMHFWMTHKMLAISVFAELAFLALGRREMREDKPCN